MLTSERVFLALASCPSGSIIAAVMGGTTLHLLDATTGSQIGAPVVTGSLSVLRVALNPAGTIVATGNADGTVRLFDVTTGRPIGSPMIAGDAITETVTWNPAGTAIVTGNDDGTLRFFDSWSESEACAYLLTVMTVEQMDGLVGIDGARSTCGHGEVRDLPRIPVLDVPLQ
jgi:WD40 repeat protein